MHQRSSSFDFPITFSLQPKYTLQDILHTCIREIPPSISQLLSHFNLNTRYRTLYIREIFHLIKHFIYIYIYVREVAPSTSQLLSHFSLNTGYSVYQRNFSFFFRSSYFSSLLSSHIYIYASEKFLFRALNYFLTSA